MSMQQMLLGIPIFPSFTFRGATEAESAPATSATIGAPSGTVAGDFQVIYAWQDTTNTVTFTASSGWTKIDQSSERPQLSVFYSTTDTGTATVNGATFNGEAATKDWNLIRLVFTPNRTINSINVSVDDYLGSASAYSHQITPPSDGADYTYIHTWAVSGRPVDSVSEPASISKSPSGVDDPIEVTNSDSAAVAYYVLHDPRETTLGTYTYNNINDTGRQRSGGLWIGFT